MLANGKTIVLVLLFLGLFTPLLVRAAAINLNLDYPEFFGIDLKTAEGQSLESIIAWFYAFIVGIAGLAAFVMIVWGGVQWMTSAGDPTKTSDAKDRIKKALLGLLLILASFVILRVINPELTTLRITTLPTIKCPKDDKGECIPFEFSAGSSSTYRCGPLGGTGNNFLCSGALPVVDQGSSGSGEQCIITQSSGSSGNCPTQCRSAGGESARVGDVWNCCNVPNQGECRIGGETFTFAQTTEGQPLMQSVMRENLGVYGCDDDGCKKSWRKFVEDTADVCNDRIADSSPRDDSICEQIGSLWIHGEFVVVLYENKNYGGKRICFEGRQDELEASEITWSPEGRLINRLDDYEIVKNNGWNRDTESIRILRDGETDINTLCSLFEETQQQQ